MLMFNLKLKDRRIYLMNRSHAITIPIVWLESWRGEIGDWVHLRIGENGELIITPVKAGENIEPIRRALK